MPPFCKIHNKHHMQHPYFLDGFGCPNCFEEQLERERLTKLEKDKASLPDRW